MPNNLTSPKMESFFACVLGQPRSIENSPDRVWSMKGKMKAGDQDCQSFQAYLHDQYEQIHGKKKPHQHGLPFVEEKIDDEYTGDVIFKFKRNEFKKNGDPWGAPIVKTADPNINWPQDKLIGNGSLVRVSFQISKWEMSGKAGISLRLQAVQVLKHVPYEADGSEVFKVEEEYIQDIPTDAGSVASTNPDITQEDMEF